MKMYNKPELEFVSFEVIPPVASEGTDLLADGATNPLGTQNPLSGTDLFATTDDEYTKYGSAVFDEAQWTQLN